jgi:hypothetical protein
MTDMRQKAEVESVSADLSHGPLNKVNVHHIRMLFAQADNCFFDSPLTAPEV